jgi:hypothetical protein
MGGDSKASELIKTEQGCTEPTRVPVWQTEYGKFFNCPVAMIPQNIRNWDRENAYNSRDNIRMKPYHEENARYVDAQILYDTECSKYLRLMRK